MATVTSTLNGNLAEGSQEHAMSLKRSISTSSFRNTNVIISVDNETVDSVEQENEDKKDAVHTTLRFTITMDKLELNLFTSPMVSPKNGSMLLVEVYNFLTSVK